AEAAAALPLAFSGKSRAALRAQAEQLRELVASAPGTRLADVGYSLATTRATFTHRCVILAADHDGFLQGLDALLAERPALNVVHGRAERSGKSAFLFSGQGSQCPGMGAQLYERFAAFATAFDQVRAHVDPFLDVPLREVMFSAGETASARLLNQTWYTQPALFAFHVSLYRLLESFGLAPDFLLGHSIGELSAAHLAGVLSLEDACTLAVSRGRLMQALPGDGAMIAVQATEDELLASLRQHGDRASIAAINAPDALVLSGDDEVVTEIAGHWAQRGRKTKRLAVSHAFHSPRMDPILDDFHAVAARLAFHVPVIPVISDLTGQVAADDLATPDYWTRHIRGTVRFGAGLRTLRELGATTYLEIGPTAALAPSAHQALDGAATVIAALRAGRNEPAALLSGLAEMHARGSRVDWTPAYAGLQPRAVPLPTYPFEHRDYWLDPPPPARGAGDLGLDPSDHPLLGAGTALGDGDSAVFTGLLTCDRYPWLGDHAIADVPLLPGTALLELVLYAGRQVGCGLVDELVIDTPLVLPADGKRLRILVGDPDEQGHREVVVSSSADGREWIRHAVGLVGTVSERPGRREEATWPPPEAIALDTDDLYEDLADRGYGYGPAFRGLRAAWRRGGDVFAEVAVPEGVDTRGYGVHPALLDAALHALFLVEGQAEPRVPFSWHGVTLHEGGAAAVRAQLTPAGPDAYAITLTDMAGAPVATVGRLRVRPAHLDQLAAESASRSLFELGWTTVEAATPDASAITVLGDGFPGLAARLADAGVAVETHPDLGALAGAIDRGGTVPAVVLAPFEPPPDSDAPPARVRMAANRALALTQAWLADGRFASARLVVLTSGAMAIRDSDAADLATSAVWGLVKSA
ncbi:MAG: acyltransferase domain-containing protein, partial [Trebonia sp.]